MKFNSLTYKNIRYFCRYYKLVSLAVIITVAVITGSLVVGNSVRNTLVKRVAERLGNTETIIFSRHSFMEERLMDTPLFNKNDRGILLSNGFISLNGRLIPVFVWGVSDMNISKGTAKINPALQKEIGDNPVDDIILRLPATGLVPSGSIFVTESYTTSLRLLHKGIIEADKGGNISMKNEQILPFNVFVNREELAETLETEGKINLIFTDKQITYKDLEEIWDYTLSGLSVNNKEGFSEITSDRVFIQEEVISSISKNNAEPNRLFSYLANAIEKKNRSIPYSFVTALDRYNGLPLSQDEIILSDYSASCINARTGDTIQLTYFTSQDLKTLKTDTICLKVKMIVPLSELMKDNSLSADFPGLSDVERCTDWDSDLPIDMNLITDEDERYWDLYKSTPKAIIPYEAVAPDWSNAYGSATAIRVTNADPDLSELRPKMFGIQLIYPQEMGLYAARNGVDFSGLFLALGFFIIVSAMILMQIPLSEMLYKRRHEIALLKALGYTRKRIRKLLWRESAPVVFASSLIGIFVGLLYTVLIMWLLGNVWKGATHTDGFSVYPGIRTISIGLLIGIGLSLGLLYQAITSSLKDKPYHLKKKKTSLNRRKAIAIIISILALFTIFINVLLVRSVTLFVIVGILFIGVATLWGDYLIVRNGAITTTRFDRKKMIWGTLYANKKQAVSSFLTLTIGAFIVFSVGLNRQGFADSSQIRTGTGGYSLWCESAIPIYHNMGTQAGREKLSLSELPSDTEILQCLRHSADDASCLNLNKVSTPSVLGIDMKALSASDFQITQSIQTSTDTVYPALIDATVLTWGLMMNVGDTLHYINDKGQPVSIVLIGTLANSIFQGNILIDRSLFSEIWQETTGSEVFLLKVNEAEKEEVKTLLSQALNEYGVKVSTTSERLKQFNTVTDTYLTIFLTLGGIGLLLGIMSFIIVVRKNLAMRRREIDLYRTLGFTDKSIENILYRENRLVPLYAIITGVISALVGVSISFMNTSVWIWLLALLFTFAFICCTLIFIRKSVKNVINPKTIN